MGGVNKSIEGYLSFGLILGELSGTLDRFSLFILGAS